MYQENIIKIAIKELISPTFQITKQYLKIYKYKKVDNNPLIERLQINHQENIAIVYIPIVDKDFYLSIYIDLEKMRISGITTESKNVVYFHATSEKLNFEELKAMTILTPTKGWSIGDKRNFTNGIYSFSSINFEPNPEIDSFQNKLKNLLEFLEQDRIGIKRLVTNAFGYIQASITFNNMNGCLGGLSIDKDCIKRMSNLEVKIDFDLYTS